MSNRFFFLCWGVLVVLLLGCATQHPRKEYYSQPQIQRAANAIFDVRIEPVKQGNPFYVAFQLTLTNKSAQPIAIDWNRSRYFSDGQDLGVFVFKGIDPESVKDGIPEEIVAPGETLDKRISPYRTLAFRYGKDFVQADQHRIYAGILPDGDNTVLLSVEQGGHVYEERLTVQLLTRDMAQ